MIAQDISVPYARLRDQINANSNGERCIASDLTVSEPESVAIRASSVSECSPATHKAHGAALSTCLRRVDPHDAMGCTSWSDRLRVKMSLGVAEFVHRRP